MTLTGKLEDLALTDIIQIISLSKRTGILEIETDRGEKGYILFKNGFVVSAISPDSFHITLGEMLKKHGLIDEAQLKRALHIQRTQAQRKPLGQILVQLGILSEEMLEDIVKQQIYRSIYEMLKIQRGSFTFRLSEIIPFDDIRLYPMDLVLLEKGVNAQQVLLDALKIQDEERRDQQEMGEGEESVSDEDIFIDATLQDIAMAPDSETQELPFSAEETLMLADTVGIIISPDPTRMTLISHEFENYRIVPIEVNLKEPQYIEKRVLEWKDLKRTVFIFLDIIKMDTSRIVKDKLIELIQSLIQLEIPLYIMTDNPQFVQVHINNIQQKHVEILPVLPMHIAQGIQLLLSRQVRHIIVSLIRYHREKEKREIEDERPGLSWMEKLRSELGMEIDIGTETTNSRFQYVLAQLKRALDELRSPSETPQISLLVLQFASEFLDRGILLLRSREGLIGLGGFGDTGDDEPMPIKVRRIRIHEIAGDFAFVLEHKVPVRKKVLETLPTWLKTFLGLVGRYRPTEYVLFPIVVQNETIGILYGDNGVTHHPIGDLTYLEILLNQAGFALENALLQKKLSKATFT